MKLITLARICASTKKVSRARTLIDSISTRVRTALGARLNQIALADFADDLRATPYRTALDGPSKTALDLIEAADALIIGAAATRIGSFPSLLLHLLELCDPDQLRGKPAIFISVGGSGAAPHLASLQLRFLARFAGLRTISIFFCGKSPVATISGRQKHE